MAKEKACKQCRAVYTGTKCTKCGASSSESTDGFKGKVYVLDPEESELAKNLKIDSKGAFAIKLR